MKLETYATIRSGLVLSRKKALGPDGVDYKLLNLRSVADAGYIDMDELDDYRASEVLSQDYLTHAGDIVVRLSAPYTAVLIDKQTEGIVVSSNFVIIRTDTSKILPEYLFWVLNTEDLKRYIAENATSNVLNAVTAKYYSNLKWNPIPLKDQKMIAEINLLAKREVMLLNQLAKEKEKYYTAAIQQFQKARK